MSSNRLSYDNCDYQQRNVESVSPLTYQLYSGKYLTCDWCGKNNSPLTSELKFNDRVSIENDLLNINRKQSRCDSQKHRPTCDNPTQCQLDNKNFVNHRVCDRNVVWTNLVKPSTPGFNQNTFKTFKCA